MHDPDVDATSHASTPPARAPDIGASLHAVARAARPRADFVAALESHLGRQAAPAAPGPRRRPGGFRAVTVVAVLAFLLGALAIGGAMLRGAVRGQLRDGLSPTATAGAAAASIPTTVSIAVPVAVGGLAAWVPPWLADPTVVYLLLTLGALAVLLEIVHPGGLLPGVVGGVALLLGGVGLLALPLNGGALVLLLLALALVAADIQVSTHGALTLAALVAFVPGSLFLFRGPPTGQPAVALPVVLALAALLGAFGLAVGAAAARTRTLSPYRYALPEGGTAAVTVGPLAPAGVVRVAGQLWSARAAAPIAADQPVRVLVREGLTLVVQPLEPGTAGGSEFPDVDH